VRQSSDVRNAATPITRPFEVAGEKKRLLHAVEKKYFSAARRLRGIHRSIDSIQNTTGQWMNETRIQIGFTN
jgi:hypothetical protein